MIKGGNVGEHPDHPEIAAPGRHKGTIDLVQGIIEFSVE